MKTQNIGTKEIGYIVIAMSLILLVLMISITDQLNQSIHADCIHEPEVCPMTSNFPIQSYVGFTVTIIFIIFGIYLIYKSRQIDKTEKKIHEENKNVINILNIDERKVYETIKESDGVVFQGDLIEKLEFNKVKVTRILDTLEHKGLIERRRRGMSNVVFLKKH
ncbi:MAG: MarR family transcriptional regulator [Nanoarchaeota archaeon]|nr:MarR family transcriptional regulator [Nanoarchaeota archaeon]MBU1135350.1 MarR family transcriptional regulator [Nanoarchaeota archaeon]MBU2519714.1 MarR family transcriptional regulator [Nanoarchaeota archaeon]